MVKKMKKTLTKILFAAAVLFLFGACNDPVFYTVSKAIPRIPPLISGSPTKFAQIGPYIFVASGRSLFMYEPALVGGGALVEGEWTQPDAPAGRFWDIAATANYLYAVIEGPGSIGQLWRTDLPITDSSWSIIPLTDKNVQTIHTTGTGASERLFINTRTGANSFNIYFFNDTLPLPPLPTQITNFETDDDGTPVFQNHVGSLLRGAAFDGTNYFLCTLGHIFQTNSSLINPVSISDDSEYFVGIITLPVSAHIVTITAGGVLYRVLPGSLNEIAKFEGRRASGALAVWEDGPDRLLLVGRGDTAYSTTTGRTFGYLEIQFNNTGTFLPAGDPLFRVPGDPDPLIPSTVNNRANYAASIGSIAINHIVQAADGKLFASTASRGAWRYNEDIDQWNAVPRE